LVVGGLYKRCEYLAVGEGMRQACESETKASNGGETICSDEVRKYVNNNFEFLEVKDGNSREVFWRIIGITGERMQIVSESYLMRKNFEQNKKLKDKFSVIKTLIPAAVGIYLEIEKEIWSKEIRMLTIMFLNLKVDLSQTKNESGLERIQEIVRSVQRSIYRTRGGLNKFLMDDKGSVMLLCWGIPPMSHSDDHTRSVLSGLTLIKELRKTNCGAYMGITTGTCFTGVCGTIGNRREYSLLGEIVNLSARFMQKAISYGKEKKLDYCVLIDEKTRGLVQNKVRCEYICQDELKGFTERFKFYAPVIKVPEPSLYNIFPLLLTHRNNIPTDGQGSSALFEASLYMVGRDKELECFKTCICDYLRQKSTEVLVIRGFIGSGKSLLIRRGMYELFESNKELKKNYLNKPEYPSIFMSYQNPLTYTNPLNGFHKILRKIYRTLTTNKIRSKCIFKTFPESDVTLKSNDIIGDLLIESEGCFMIPYIEEILKTSLSKHFESNSVIQSLPQRDNFFESRKVLEFSGDMKIVEFFTLMVKKYKELLDSKSIPSLIFIVEDTHYIDELSVDFMRALRKLNLPKVILILSYQDRICGIVKNQYDKMQKASDIMFPENTIYMENILDIKVIKELLINHTAQQGKIIKTIDTELIKILISKSFKGIPLFVLDIFDNLVSSNKYIQQLYTEMIITSELLDMEINLNWTDFTVPVRIEKIIGSIIDQLNAKEIIVLKCASVIGNVFDIQKLHNLNPLGLNVPELYSLLSNLEKMYIIEFLDDVSPKKLVCKFSLPFLREILYQRMLIEQRTEIHNNIARTLQTSKIKYMSYNMEVKYLYWHLQTSERTLMAHLEEEDDTKSHLVKENLNLHNMKIFLIKDIVNRLNSIELRLDSEGNSNIPCIKSGTIEKKSDKGPRWEGRYCVISNIKLFYWYYEKDYKELKQPLGFFFLKDINKVNMLGDNEVGGRNNLFKISVTSWFKKEVQKGSRSYFFSVKSREELINWVISINFLRVKVTYDEFSKNYGMINLPLQHECKKHKKREKLKFMSSRAISSKNIAINTSISNSSSLYNSIARKKTLSNEKLSSESSRLLIRQSFYMGVSNDNSTESLLDQVTRMKNNLRELLSYGFVITLGCIQEIVFNDQYLNDDKCFYIPGFLKESLNDTNEFDDSAKSSYNDNNIVVKITMLNDSEEKKIIIPSTVSNLDNELIIISNNVQSSVDESQSGQDSSQHIDGMELSFDNKTKNIFHDIGTKEPQEVPSDETTTNKPPSNKSIVLLRSDTFSLGDSPHNSNKGDELKVKERSKFFRSDSGINNKYDKFIRPFSFGPDANNPNGPNATTDDEKKDTNEEDEIYPPSIPVKTELVPKYSEPKFDYLKKTNNIYKPYSSKLFQNLK
jgi:Cdc6-like AAA superfamily ATPase